MDNKEWESLRKKLYQARLNTLYSDKNKALKEVDKTLLEAIKQLEKLKPEVVHVRA